MQATLARHTRGDKDRFRLTQIAGFSDVNGRWETIQNEVSLARWCKKDGCTIPEYSQRHECVPVSMCPSQRLRLGSNSKGVLAR
jgi:hypothetical protein